MIEKKEFPTLQTLSQQVVAQNYHLYPELNGLTERLKETVLLPYPDHLEIHRI